jgi:hypothetical protein
VLISATIPQSSSSPPLPNRERKPLHLAGARRSMVTGCDFCWKQLDVWFVLEFCCGGIFHVSPLVNGVRVIRFTPPAGGKPCPSLCKTISFPWTQNKSAFAPPSIGGSPMLDQPAAAYNGPLMQSTLGTNTVLTSSGTSGVRERYDFATDTITRVA